MNNEKTGIKQAIFVKSSSNYTDCPEENYPEVAFIGRSNVGKSSLINVLTERKKLAKTSSTPGKTRLINHFLIDERWHLVDLPGYGWAKVGKEEKGKWEKMIKKYFLHRKSLNCVFVLIDIRHKPQAIDLEMLQWLGENGLPVALVFTKSDKLGKLKVLQSVQLFEKTLMESWEKMPPHFITSAVLATGRDTLLHFILKHCMDIRK